MCLSYTSSGGKKAGQDLAVVEEGEQNTAMEAGFVGTREKLNKVPSGY
jgi:hypothetical protein